MTLPGEGAVFVEVQPTRIQGRKGSGGGGPLGKSVRAAPGWAGYSSNQNREMAGLGHMGSLVTRSLWSGGNGAGLRAGVWR